MRIGVAGYFGADWVAHFIERAASGAILPADRELGPTPVSPDRTGREWEARLRAAAPPWVVHPGFPPADPFWRQSGEHWLHDVWKPFWDSLDAREQERYLDIWSVPREWWDYYLDSGFQAWLASDDSF